VLCVRVDRYDAIFDTNAAYERRLVGGASSFKVLALDALLAHARQESESFINRSGSAVCWLVVVIGYFVSAPFCMDNFTASNCASKKGVSWTRILSGPLASRLTYRLLLLRDKDTDKG